MKSEIANQVVKLRKRFDLEQADLSSLFGLGGQKVVYRWETDRRTPSQIVQRLIRFLNDAPKAEAAKVLKGLGKYSK